MDKKLDILLDNKATVLSHKTNNKTSSKEGMSLFDQLLNDTKKSISVQKELNNTSNHKSNKKIDKLENQTLTNKSIGSSSLLDKLIFETNKKVSQNEKNEIKEIKNNEKTSSSKLVESLKNTSNELKNIDNNTNNNLNNKSNENIKTDNPNNKTNENIKTDNANNKSNENIKTDKPNNKSNENIKTDTLNKKTAALGDININKQNEKNVSSENKIENFKNKIIIDGKNVINKNPSINQNTQKSENSLNEELEIKSTKSSSALISNQHDVSSSSTDKDNLKSNISSAKTVESTIKVDSKTGEIKKEVFSNIKNENKEEKIEISSKKENNNLNIIEKNIPSMLEKDDNNSSFLKNEKNTSTSSAVLSNENTKDVKLQVSDTSNVPKNLNNDLNGLENSKDMKNDVKIIKDENLKQEEPKKELKNGKSQILKENIGINVNDKNNSSEKVLTGDTKDTSLQNNNLKVNDANSNKNAANEFAKLSTSESPLEKIKLNKEDILNKNNTSSLKNEQKIENNLEKNSEKVSLIGDKIDVKSSKESLLSNIFLSSQQRVVSRQEMQTLSENKKSIVEDKSIVTLKTVAKDLELDLTEVKMDSKKSDKKVLSKELVLDKLAFSKNILKTNIENILGTVNANIIENELNDLPDLTLNVSGLNLNSLETKIISAKQNVSSLMSDIAKKMYENYKPPVTAFRMLLNPSTLGSISVIMKHDKENGLSISLNMSSQNTLETMNENESTLRSALSKTFLDDSEFSLDFNMQGDGRNQEKEEKQEHARNSTNEILESLSNNINAESLENNQNYM